MKKERNGCKSSDKMIICSSNILQFYSWSSLCAFKLLIKKQPIKRLVCTKIHAYSRISTVHLKIPVVVHYTES